MQDFSNGAGSMRALINANDISRFRDSSIKMSQQLNTVRMSNARMSEHANQLSGELRELESLWNEFADISCSVAARLLNNVDTTNSIMESREHWAMSFASNCCAKLLLSAKFSSIVKYPFELESDKIKYNIFATVSLLTGLRIAFDPQMQLSIEQVLVKEYLQRVQSGLSISSDRDSINSALVSIKKSLDYLTRPISLFEISTQVFNKLPKDVSINQLWSDGKPTSLLTTTLIESLSPVEILKQHCPQIIDAYSKELLNVKYLSDTKDWLAFLNEKIDFLIGYKVDQTGKSTLYLLRDEQDSRLTEEDKILMSNNSQDISNNPKFRW